MSHARRSMVVAIAALLVMTSVRAVGIASAKSEAPHSAAALIRERTGVVLPWRDDRYNEAEVADSVRSLLLGELSEAKAVKIALINNRTLRSELEGIGITKADFSQALLPRNPTIEGETRSGGGEGNPGELAIMQDLSSVLLTPIRRRAAGTALKQATLQAADAALRTTAEARSAFYGVQAAEGAKKHWEANVAAAELGADVAIRQREAGNITALDLEGEQALYEQSKLELARSHLEVLEARERLNRVMGLWGKDTGWRLSAELPELPTAEPPMDALESIAIAQRLDLAASEAAMKALAQSAPLARWAAFPELRAGVHVEKEPEGTRTIGPAVEIAFPLFDRGQAGVAKVRAQVRQAQNRHTALGVEIRSETRMARERLLATRQLVEYYRDVVIPRRSRIAEQTQLHFNGMLIGIYQLLQAKQAEANAKRESIEARRDYWIARAELERAIGGPLPDTGAGE